jgi:hypothetical protein
MQGHDELLKLPLHRKVSWMDAPYRKCGSQEARPAKNERDKAVCRKASAPLNERESGGD